jgi:hypothetical protein
MKDKKKENGKGRRGDSNYTNEEDENIINISDEKKDDECWNRRAERREGKGMEFFFVP